MGRGGMTDTEPNNARALAAKSIADDDLIPINSGDQSSNNNELLASSWARGGGRRRVIGRGDQNDRKHKKKAAGGGGRARNSYLKILMDDESVDLMHDMAQRIRQVVRKNFPDVPEYQVEDTNETVTSDKLCDGNGLKGTGYPPPKKRKPPRPLTFKPRSRNSLHMTFFFGGTTICEIPQEELEVWHDQVMARLKLASRPVGNNESGETEASRYTLQFRELCLFPPRRNTLVVAIFEGSQGLHRLHDDLRDIAKDSNSDGLKEVVNRSKDRWTAHVTLGDLYGGGRGEVKQESLIELAKTLKDGAGLEVFQEKDAMMRPSDFTAKVRGIAMGGPVPPQVELNWNHFF